VHSPVLCTRPWFTLAEVSKSVISKNGLRSLDETGFGQSDLEYDASSKYSEKIMEKVENVYTSAFTPYLILFTSQQRQSMHLQHRIVLLNNLPMSNSDVAEDLNAMSIPGDIMSECGSLLGVLNNDCVAFLDRSMRVCTWRLKANAGAGDVKRHFFIPRDWISDQNIGITRALSTGLILCPRQGQVTVIDSAIGTE
jgi:hypothetical protein